MELILDLEEHFNKIQEMCNKRKRIDCPHCNYTQEEGYVVTHYGSMKPKEKKCERCSGKFFVQEVVDRIYKVTKTESQ